MPHGMTRRYKVPVKVPHVLVRMTVEEAQATLRLLSVILPSNAAENNVRLGLLKALEEGLEAAEKA